MRATCSSSRPRWLASAVSRWVRRRATWVRIRSRSAIAFHASSRIACAMWSATFEGVSKRRWATSSRIVESSLVPDPGEDRDRHPADPPRQLQIVEPGEIGDRAPAPDDRQRVVGTDLVRVVDRADGVPDRLRGVPALEGGREVIEVAETGLLESVRLAAEVALTRRGRRADHRDPDEFLRPGQAFIRIVDILRPEGLADGPELGEQVAEREGGVDVLDDQVEAVDRVEVRLDLDEHLDVRLQVAAGALGELAADRRRTPRPDHPLGAGDRQSPGVALLQFQVDVLAPGDLDLADLGATQTGSASPALTTPFTRTRNSERGTPLGSSASEGTCAEGSTRPAAGSQGAKGASSTPASRNQVWLWGSQQAPRRRPLPRRRGPRSGRSGCSRPWAALDAGKGRSTDVRRHAASRCRVGASLPSVWWRRAYEQTTS